jgi:DegV family protein with EDD domain
MIAVVTDTCASIPPSLADSLQIEVVPYYIHMGQETLRDMVDISHEEFYQLLPTAAQLPTTANPGPGDYLEAFERAAQRSREIVVICMTSKCSGAYQSALIAREMAALQLPGLNIEVIDTQQVAMVHGWASVEAARAGRQGANIQEVVDVIRYVARTGQLLKTSDTLKYLYMGGRIGRARHLAGSLLQIKPIVSMEDGIIVAKGKARSIHKAFDKMLELMAERVPPGRPIKVAMTHGAAPERVECLYEKVRQVFTCQEVLFTQLSPVLGTHTGPGVVGLSYFPVPDE